MFVFMGGNHQGKRLGLGCLWGEVTVWGRYIPGLPWATLAALPCFTPDSPVTLSSEEGASAFCQGPVRLLSTQLSPRLS